jgi:Helix-turn-helix.
MDMKRKSISDKIFYLRNIQGFTREQFAEETELSVSYLYQLESGKKSIGLGALIRVAQTLGVTLDELVATDTKLPCNREVEVLLLGLVRDCSLDELHIIIKNANSLKESLKEYQKKN